MILSLQVMDLAPSPSSGAWVAIAGIVGTLMGAALGAFVTWKIQKQQLEHEDRTRFYDRRLSTYADFTYACGFIVAGLDTGVSVDEQTRVYVRSWETLRLIASPAVVAAGSQVHTDARRALTENVGDLNAFKSQFNDHMVAFLNAIRREIGVERAQSVKQKGTLGA